MPFTPTHTLAIIPAARWLPLSALAIGSMIPDLPLYTRFGPDYTTMHSFAGLVTACLPMGLCVYVLFHALVKRPLVALAPDFVRARLRATIGRRPDMTPSHVASVVAAVVLGALTHIVWDAFTHAGRWGVKAVALLEESVQIGGVDVPGYALFQHGASVVGLPLLAWLIWRWLHRQPPLPIEAGMPRALRVSMLALLLVVPALAGLQAVVRYGFGSIGDELVRFVTVGGGVFLLLLIVFGALYTVSRRLWRSAKPAPMRASVRVATRTADSISQVSDQTR